MFAVLIDAEVPMNKSLSLFVLLLLLQPLPLLAAPDAAGPIEGPDLALKPILDYNGGVYEPQDTSRWQVTIKVPPAEDRWFITVRADQAWIGLGNIAQSQPTCVTHYLADFVPGGGDTLTIVVMNDGACTLPPNPIRIAFDIRLIDEGPAPDTASITAHLSKRQFGSDIYEEKDVTHIVQIWQTLP